MWFRDQLLGCGRVFPITINSHVPSCHNMATVDSGMPFFIRSLEEPETKEGSSTTSSTSCYPRQPNVSILCIIATDSVYE